MLMLSLTAMLVISAIPVAFAQDRDDRREDRQEERQEDRIEDNGFFFGGDRFDEDRFDDGFFFFDGDRFDEDRFDDFDNGSGVEQSFDQDADSGDVDQSFEVTGGGDNSNQCVGVSGNANTGNLQSQTGFVQYASEIEEFEQDDVGNDLTVGGDSTTTCDQQVNQAAAAG